MSHFVTGPFPENQRATMEGSSAETADKKPQQQQQKEKKEKQPQQQQQQEKGKGKDASVRGLIPFPPPQSLQAFSPPLQ